MLEQHICMAMRDSEGWTGLTQGRSLTTLPRLRNMTLSNTSSTRVEGWWMVIATVRSRLHTEDRVSTMVRAVVESVVEGHGSKKADDPVCVLVSLDLLADKVIDWTGGWECGNRDRFKGWHAQREQKRCCCCCCYFRRICRQTRPSI